MRTRITEFRGRLLGKVALIASLILSAFTVSVRADTGGDWLLPPAVQHPVIGQDIWQFESADTRVIYAGKGHLDVRVYGAPVGRPDQNGWHFRDTSITWSQAAGVAETSDALPFQVTVHPGLTSPIATLQSENAKLLGITLDGFQFIGGPNQVRGSVVGLIPNQSGNGMVDASLRATVSGLALSLTLPVTATTSLASIDLRPAPNASFVPLTNGAIEITEPYTDYASDGTPVVGHEPEFVIEAPIVDDGGAPTAAAGVTVGTSLQQHADGSASLVLQQLTVPSSYAARASFVRVTVPVLTFVSALRTAQVAGASSCVANGAQQTEDVAVGQSNGCAWAALAKLDLTELPNGYLVQSANLHVAPPTALTGLTGVVTVGDSGISSLTASAFPEPWRAVSWQDLSSRLSASSASPQQSLPSLDVSNIVRQWASGGSQNDGFVLAGTGPFVPLALRADTGMVGEGSLPYIDLAMYAPLRPLNQDGTISQYGIAGGFDTCAPPSCTAGVLSAYQMAGLNASYMRIGSVINCNGGNGNTQPGSGRPLVPAMQTAYASTPIVIPVVNFSSNTTACTSTSFANDIGNFINLLKSQNVVGSHPIYFEIGNEENCCGNPSRYGGSASSFGSFFKAAAQKITSLMTGSNVHLIVGAIFPGEWGVNQCDGSLNYTEDALAQWSNADVAAHPYQFYTANTSYWRNFIPATNLSSSPGACHDLSTLIDQWHNSWPTKTIWFTEENWVTTVPSSTCNQGLYTKCEGYYLADRFTWLADKGYVNGAASGYVRDIWYEGVDESGTRPLGLYSGSSPKALSPAPYCPHYNPGQYQLPGLYQDLALANSCY